MAFRLTNENFAVMDGARFGNLPILLKQKRLFARSLFLDQVDEEITRAGPWLVSLGQAPDASEKVSLLVEEGDRTPTIIPPVYWQCNRGEMILYRHLRTLNLALIPLWAAQGYARPSAISEQASQPTVVFFRHYDPDVLAALLPCLNAAQFSRILGPADTIRFFSKDHGGHKRIASDTNWPARPAGMLALDDDQCCALIMRRQFASHKRLAAFLRECAPFQTESFSDAELAQRIQIFESQAKDLSIYEEKDIGIWSYMQLTSKIDFSKDQSVVEFMSSQNNGITPSARLASLFDLRVRCLSNFK